MRRKGSVNVKSRAIGEESVSGFEKDYNGFLEVTVPGVFR